MKKYSLMAMVMAAAFVLLGGSLANAATWTNGDGTNDWNTGGNWDSGDVPGSGDDANIELGGGDKAVIPSGGATNAINAMNVKNGGEVDILGDLTLNATDTRSIHLREGSTVNQMGGFVSNAGWTRINVTGDLCTYNLSGGTLDSHQGVRMGYSGQQAGADLYITGGSLYAGDGIDFQTQHPSTLGLLGSEAGRIVSGERADGTAGDGGFYFDSGRKDEKNKTLKIGIDADGLTPLEVLAGDVVFDEGGNNPFLDVSFLDGSDRGGEWTVMEWHSGANVVGADSLDFVSGVDDEMWSFNVSDTDNNLTVSYVPEPSSLLLLGLAGLLLMKRRRI